MQGKNFENILGYWNAVMIFGGAMLLLMPILIYLEYDKIRRRKFDIEGSLILLEKETDMQKMKFKFYF
jgi:hypothetical protein